MNNEEKTKKKHPVLKVVLIVLVIIVGLLGIGGVYLYGQYKEFAAQTMAAQQGIIGTEAPDFTVTTTDGKELTLSKVLEEKEVVVLNIFATWCGPCKAEFPDFEKTYQKYGDKLEIISLSQDTDDTMEDIAAYKEENGLSFPMGITGEDGTFDFVPVGGYPTTMVIDRNRKVVFCQSGTFLKKGTFEELVTSFMGDAYDGSPVFMYTLNSHTGEEFMGGVTVKLTAEDGSETELTSEDDGLAVLKTNTGHTFKVTVVSTPDGWAVEKVSPETVGPQSGYITVQLKAK